MTVLALDMAAAVGQPVVGTLVHGMVTRRSTDGMRICFTTELNGNIISGTGAIVAAVAQTLLGPYFPQYDTGSGVRPMTGSAFVLGACITLVDTIRVIVAVYRDFGVIVVAL